MLTVVPFMSILGIESTLFVVILGAARQGAYLGHKNGLSKLSGIPMMLLFSSTHKIIKAALDRLAFQIRVKLGEAYTCKQVIITKIKSDKIASFRSSPLVFPSPLKECHRSFYN